LRNPAPFRDPPDAAWALFGVLPRSLQFLFRRMIFARIGCHPDALSASGSPPHAAGGPIMRCLLAALAAVLLAAGPAPAAEGRRPNVIVFLADDVGWGEFGFQGHQQIPTPHIDSIAKNAVRFTNGYVAATYCSPSRAGMLTGRYPTRFGHEFNEGVSV